jgi:hypothetical protein
MAVMGINVVVRVVYAADLSLFGRAAIYDPARPLTPMQIWTFIFGALELLVLLASPVTLFWIYRVSENAWTFRKLTNSSWGAILWYLVPFASLYKPYQAMSEIWAASEVKYRRGGDRLVAVWWTVFLIGGVANLVGLTMRTNGAAVAGGVTTEISGAVVSVVFGLVVHRITSMQILKHQVEPFAEPPDLAFSGDLERFLR